MLYKKKESKSYLEDWKDLYFQTKTGYINVTNLSDGYGAWYGLNDVEKLISDTTGKPKQYMSINAFGMDSTKRVLRRTKGTLKQIRNIAIDIDQYTKDISIEEALDVITTLVLDDVIPEPNFIYTSRGIQVFYNINDGASPGIEWLTHYITCEFIERLQDIGADIKASDSTRLMRVPYSINEKNGSVVLPEMWNNERYSLDVLRKYTDLDTYQPARNDNQRLVENKVLNLKTIKFRNTLFYSSNHARIQDLERLYELRKGLFTNLRNQFVYIYSYHYSLIFNNQSNVLKQIEKLTEDIKSEDNSSFTSKEIKNTVKSAYEDARRFLEQYKKDGYKIVYRANDGIIKPMKTSTVIKKLDITEDEQQNLHNLYSSKFKQAKEAERVRRYYGLKGTMEEYNQSRKDKKFEDMETVRALKSEGKTHKEIAEVLNKSTKTVQRLIKELKGIDKNE